MSATTDEACSCNIPLPVPEETRAVTRYNPFVPPFGAMVTETKTTKTICQRCDKEIGE